MMNITISHDVTCHSVLPYPLELIHCDYGNLAGECANGVKSREGGGNSSGAICR